MGKRIAVIGSGYVGSVVAACLAHVGHQVIGVESDAAKLQQLSSGVAPFHEPGLDPLIMAGVSDGSLRFTSDFQDAMANSDVVFVCVGTPPGPDGEADTSAIRGVARSIARNLTHYHVIVTKSTVPIGTGYWLASLIEDIAGPEGRDRFGVVSNPEFLREGNAVQDFLHPDRVVLGSDDPRALQIATDMYRPILEQQIPGDVGHREVVPLLQTKLTTAEMIKYASNAFLATKISFANEIARLCDFVGADITEVTAGMGLDTRIGGRFLDAGLGWGGSCFGKDLSALVSTAEEYGYRPRILEGSIAVNQSQRKYVAGHQDLHPGPGLQAGHRRPAGLTRPRRGLAPVGQGGLRHGLRPHGPRRARGGRHPPDAQRAVGRGRCRCHRAGHRVAPVPHHRPGRAPRHHARGHLLRRPQQLRPRAGPRGRLPVPGHRARLGRHPPGRQRHRGGPVTAPRPSSFRTPHPTADAWKEGARGTD
jgi:nucleotide sugar dehydrogenase